MNKRNARFYGIFIDNKPGLKIIQTIDNYTGVRYKLRDIFTGDLFYNAYGFNIGIYSKNGFTD
ncbi:unnamed protein product [marine sediment metagenome]|uniref:Uncharacterized protein n=1 Tax=marine sediment metagenome TaxID=412755 RepID=X1JGU5_9ZZZZ